MQNLKILNKKEIKKILELLDNQFGFTDELDYVFLENNKNRIFLVNREISQIDVNKIRINSLGLYFAEILSSELRLSIEGSQIIGPKAKKNVLELTDEETRFWLKGTDIETETKLNGFVIIKHQDDFLGCGKVKQGRILNFVPKTRRLNVSD